MPGPGGSARRGCLLPVGSAPSGVCSRGGASWRPPPVMATAAGGKHSTGMHSFFLRSLSLLLSL